MDRYTIFLCKSQCSLSQGSKERVNWDFEDMLLVTANRDGTK